MSEAAPEARQVPVGRRGSPTEPAAGLDARVPDHVPPGRVSRVRSFTRRGDRMPPEHQAAYDRLAPRLVLDLPRPPGSEGGTVVAPEARLDPEALFGRRAPLVVEIGPGSGDALLNGARTRPDLDFLALEVWRPGIGQALARMGEEPLPNVRFAEVDAAQALPLLLAEGAAAEVWTFFPDPWPKAKHAKRRLIGPRFADLVHGVLAPGALWRIATDWPAYAEHVHGVLDADARFALLDTERAPLRPVTRFERRGVAAGRPIADTTWRRLP